MSITHSLMIETEQTPRAIGALLHANVTGLRDFREGWLRGEGVRVYVGAIDGYSQGVHSELYGLRSTVAVLFYMESDEDEDEGERIIGRAVAAVLNHVAGDAILLCVGEVPVMRRTKERVSVTDECGTWVGESLAAAGLAFESRELVMPAA